MTHKRRAKADPCTTGRLLTFFIEDSARGLALRLEPEINDLLAIGNEAALPPRAVLGQG